MNIYAYKNSSKTAKALAEALGVKRLKHEGKPLGDKRFINWGASKITREGGVPINPPAGVRRATNKLSTFAMLEGDCPIPPWTQSPVEATRWLAEGSTVVARTVLDGNSGEGIILVKPGDDLPEAPLYTKYVPKTDEYRIHVFNGDIHFMQRKAKKEGVEVNKDQWKIRNHGNGFIFAHKGLNVPVQVQMAATVAVETLGLDFGAVDVGWHEKHGVKVYEVNTAPGLEGASLASYVEQFKKMIDHVNEYDF